MKKQIFKEQLELVNRLNNGYINSIKGTRGWRKELVKVVILTLGGHQLNNGKKEFTASAFKVEKDLKHLDISRRTIERAIHELKIEGMVLVRKDGFCIRGISRGVVLRSESTVFEISKNGLSYINGIVHNFFTGIIKTVIKFSDSYMSKVNKRIFELVNMRDKQKIEWSRDETVEFFGLIAARNGT